LPDSITAECRLCPAPRPAAAIEEAGAIELRIRRAGEDEVIRQMALEEVAIAG